MKDQKEKYRRSEIAKTDIISEIFVEIEKDIEGDLSYSQNSTDQFCAALRDLFIKEKVYRDPALTRDILIKRMNIGKDIFIKRFQYCFGMSFRECTNSLRLKESLILLKQSDLTIEEIAEKAGFRTVRTFQRQFMATYNITPKEYRKAVAK